MVRDLYLRMARGLATVGVAAVAGILALTPATARAETSHYPIAQLSAVAPVASCEQLGRMDISKAVGARTSLTTVSAKGSAAGGFCVITGVIAPKIKFEVRLPEQGWTQRFLQLGCGGLCGTLRINPGHGGTNIPLSQNALVLASTDTGHEGGGMDGEFGKDPQLRIDFAYRAEHLTALAAKALINAFYGQPEKYAYFDGCSEGGREALMEAQRFPDDFDGVAAGAPAMNFQAQNSFYHGWQARSNTGPDGRAILTAAKLPALHAAALAACDALDGLVDGQITDPRACRFDPTDAQCASNAAPSDACLTPAEVAVARKLYAGAHDAAGHHFVIGSAQVGSELAWRGVFVPESADKPIGSVNFATGTIRNLSFEEVLPPDFSLANFQFDVATFTRLRPLHPLYDATDTDLSGLQKRGGKLILWHGWSDPHISPINSIAYYQGVRTYLGPERTAGFMRLFLFPGMYHCNGGDGPSQFDVLTPLMSWVETGTAPERLVASQAAPGPGAAAANADHLNRSRPVFAYPKVARYAGSGSIDDPASFAVAPPITAEPDHYEWAGAAFIGPGFHQTCAVEAGNLVCRSPPGRPHGSELR